MDPQPGHAPGEGGCLWCGRPLPPRMRSRGSLQRFCSTGCRGRFWTAARRWALAAIEAGLITASALKAPRESVHALLAAIQRPASPAPPQTR